MSLTTTTRTESKRPSLACIRCRKRKVKCDFARPECGRCAAIGHSCAYATPPRRVDSQAFDQLGTNVNELKERMQKVQSSLAILLSENHQQTLFNRERQMVLGHDVMNPPPPQQQQQQQQGTRMTTWKLSLTPAGFRIDTNITSVADLYRTLLSGISQININTATSMFNTDRMSDSINRSSNYRSITAITVGNNNNHASFIPDSIFLTDYSGGIKPPTAASIDSNGSESDHHDSPLSDYHVILPNEGIELQHDHLINCSYQYCFLPYQIVDQQGFSRKLHNPSSVPEQLLTNSVYAWVTRHNCIYHQPQNKDKDPTTAGESYFQIARELLRKCFDKSKHSTIHALLNLYMYQLSCEKPTLAYLYIGLAIRMAQDLRLHRKECMPKDMRNREINKRLWWSTYWLDLCAALESNRPTMFDDKDCDVEYPSKLESEDEETGYRIAFGVESIKLMRIRKDITKHLPSEKLSGQSLLTSLSRLESTLTNWFNELPDNFHPNVAHRNAENSIEHYIPFLEMISSFSFCDEACLILNIQYHTTWILLHKLFLPSQDETHSSTVASPVTMLSLSICVKAANIISKLLEAYSKHSDWCHFYYCLDGVIESVHIHQKNILFRQGDSKEAVLTAQRNLVLTADVLQRSPLIHMNKLKNVIANIEEFLDRHPIDDNASVISLDTVGSGGSSSANKGKKRRSVSVENHSDLAISQQVGGNSSSNQSTTTATAVTSQELTRASYSDNNHSNQPGFRGIMLRDPNQSLNQYKHTTATAESPRNNTTATLQFTAEDVLVNPITTSLNYCSMYPDPSVVPLMQPAVINPNNSNNTNTNNDDELNQILSLVLTDNTSSANNAIMPYPATSGVKRLIRDWEEHI